MKFYEEKQYVGFANNDIKKQKLKMYKQQYKEQGFDDTVTWSLDRAMILWLYPRLKRYYEIAFEIIDEPELESDIEQILKVFNIYLNKEDLNKEEFVEFNKGLKLLFKNFHKLWW